MNRVRASFLALFAAAAIALPAAAHAAANFPLLDPNFRIVPDPTQYGCSEGAPFGFAMAMQMIQNLMNLGIMLGAFMVLVIVIYAGVLFMTTAANPEGHSQARKMLLNAILGFVIVLAAWLVVDFVMKAFYNPDDSGFGPWNQILTGGGDYCITAKPTVPLFTGGIAGSFTVPGGAPSGGYATNVGKAGALCADGNPACSVAALKALGLSDAQAKTMSCIAVTESSGNPRTPDSNTGACGTFQITTRPGNWSIAKYHQPPCSAATSCNNAACNLQTAVLMFKEQSYQPWTGINPKTGQHWNPNAVACMNKYDPGHPGR